ncbi:ribosomal protein L22 [Zopfia rhizophila CBS 207.26]|uniref:Ribosomal protein L22 n=1 Tax=Zopfia rhizophila CBS 207.26 TaxID=1314779 RepID=A0A6A6ETK8_9PEZI|nr:ribosomal protein L22 [Zopfia rhizophila CBS 207.26]
MSIRIPSRRLGQPALKALRQPSSTHWNSTSHITRRHISNPFRRKTDEDANQKPLDISNPLLEKYLESKKQAEKKGGTPRPEPQPPTLPSKSIFSMEKPSKQEEEDMQERQDAELMALKLDPDPASRRRWERKMVIRGVRRRGRLTAPQKLMRTERQSLYKSPFLATSVKKLTKVVNQIAGKTVEEALVQLRFSKKKVAQDVFKGLEIARDEAIAGRGMGLGARNGEKGKGTEIELNNGKKKIVHDQMEMYVDQAWVGKGEYDMSPEYRARGRVNMLTHKSTSFSILLKEEATRMRISDEIKKKRENRKLWVALPDRPITAQRQYCLW